MEYAIYFEADGETYRLPVNPEEIKRSAGMDAEKYRVLSDGQVVVPVGKTLEEFSFEAEFPHDERNYTNKGFKNADTWEKLFKKWQENKTIVRFIASNGLGNEVSLKVLLTQVDAIEKAGEEGDKYISLKLVEYIAPAKRYVAVPIAVQDSSDTSNPSVSANKTHTVVRGDTLWGIAKKYYGNGSQYGKIFQENAGKIKNPNLIYPGQVLAIPV